MGTAKWCPWRHWLSFAAIRGSLWLSASSRSVAIILLAGRATGLMPRVTKMRYSQAPAGGVARSAAAAAATSWKWSLLRVRLTDSKGA